jgi:ABC-2 type transport system permease protein
MSAMATTATVPPPPATAAERLRWTLVDSWTIARRDVVHWTRNPAVVLGGPLFGVMVVLLFGYVFGSAMTVPGGGDYREFLIPGMFGQTVMFGVAMTLTAVSTDVARGVTDRFRSMPMAPGGVVIGRSVADMMYSVLDLTVLVLCGLAIGWRWNEGLVPALGAVGLLLLLRFALIWVGIYVGLRVTPEAAASAWAPLYPLTMLANTFVAPESMPTWLGHVAEWNPLSATIAASRELFGNPGIGGDTWMAENAILMAIVWPLLIVAIFLPLSVRRYRNLSR